MAKHPHSESLDFILANICHLHRTRFTQLLDALNLYRGQPRLLRELWEQEDLTQSELAARLELSPATVTKMLQRMEKAGFVGRKADESDQRVSRVFLTDTGRDVQKKVEKVFKTLESESFCNFTFEEEVLLRRFMLQVRDNLLTVTGEKPWK